LAKAEVDIEAPAEEYVSIAFFVGWRALQQQQQQQHVAGVQLHRQHVARAFP